MMEVIIWVWMAVHVIGMISVGGGMGRFLVLRFLGLICQTIWKGVIRQILSHMVQMIECLAKQVEIFANVGDRPSKSGILKHLTLFQFSWHISQHFGLSIGEFHPRLHQRQ